jgi:hypothetical protein
MIEQHDIYVKAAASAKIGIWKIDIKANAIYWDAVTKSSLGRTFISRKIPNHNG